MPEETLPEVSESTSRPENGSLRELALFFLRLGTTAFGGPAAHVAIMDAVRRRMEGGKVRHLLRNWLLDSPLHV